MAGTRSDLPARTASAIIMIVVVGMALWFGGMAFTVLVLAGSAMLVWEWKGIVDRFPDDPRTRQVWLALGVCYVVLAALAILKLDESGRFLPILAAVIATDIGAYFAGRTIGGPKIAPSISPSKTWAGLGGGMTASAALLLGAYTWVAWQFRDYGGRPGPDWFAPKIGLLMVAMGAGIAVVAQAGDFFESWAKRRAGVKDSGTWIPGHGGLFDRVDGLLLACIVSLFVAWIARSVL